MNISYVMYNYILASGFLLGGDVKILRAHSTVAHDCHKSKVTCRGPVAPWVWRCFRRACSFDSMIVVVRLHPGPCCLSRVS